ncbi:hypothetical protein HispidOSU_010344, partial [Sigmodon hispidus]
EASSGCGGVWLTPEGRAADGTRNGSCREEAWRTGRRSTPVHCSMVPRAVQSDISKDNLPAPTTHISQPCLAPLLKPRFPLWAAPPISACVSRRDATYYLDARMAS